MEDCRYQKWICELKIADKYSRHRYEESSAVFYLKFSENGGISGFCLASEIFAEHGIERTADVFGEWTDSGLSLTVVTRQLLACKWEVRR